MKASLDQDLIIRFPVASAGALVGGLASGFAVTVFAPDGTTTTAPTVTETATAGVYSFTIPAAFFTAEGAGAYLALVVQTAPAPDAVVAIDIDAFEPAGPKVGASITYDAAANTLRAHAWLETERGLRVTGATDATFRLWDRSGTALVVLQTDAAPDAQGIFAFNVAAPAFAIGETATYAIVTVVYAGVTYRACVGATFSRVL